MKLDEWDRSIQIGDRVRIVSIDDDSNLDDYVGIEGKVKNIRDSSMYPLNIHFMGNLDEKFMRSEVELI